MITANVCVASTGISATTCMPGVGHVWSVASSKHGLQKDACFQQAVSFTIIENI